METLKAGNLSIITDYHGCVAEREDGVYPLEVLEPSSATLLAKEQTFAERKGWRVGRRLGHDPRVTAFEMQLEVFKVVEPPGSALLLATHEDQLWGIPGIAELNERTRTRAYITNGATLRKDYLRNHRAGKLQAESMEAFEKRGDWATIISSLHFFMHKDFRSKNYQEKTWPGKSSPNPAVLRDFLNEKVITFVDFKASGYMDHRDYAVASGRQPVGVDDDLWIDLWVTDLTGVPIGIPRTEAQIKYQEAQITPELERLGQTHLLRHLTDGYIMRGVGLPQLAGLADVIKPPIYQSGPYTSSNTMQTQDSENAFMAVL